MALSKDEMLDAIANMTVMEIVDLVQAMEEKFGVSAAAPVAVAAAGAGDAGAAAEEQTEFTVELASATESKRIGLIKAVRAITGLGLKEAKDAVDKTPTVLKEGVTKEEAEDIKKQVEEAGGTANIK